jgi:hypothetical protein
MCVNDFWERIYFPNASTRKGAETVKIEKWQFNAWIAPSLGQMLMKDIKPDHVEAMIATMQKAGKAPLAPDHRHRGASHLEGKLLHKSSPEAVSE